MRLLSPLSRYTAFRRRHERSIPRFRDHWSRGFFDVCRRILVTGLIQYLKSTDYWRGLLQLMRGVVDTQLYLIDRIK